VTAQYDTVVLSAAVALQRTFSPLFSNFTLEKPTSGIASKVKFYADEKRTFLKVAWHLKGKMQIEVYIEN